MKIAAYMPWAGMAMGGGVTFQRLIMKALCDLAKSSQHSFVFYMHSDEIKSSGHLAENIDLVPIDYSFVRRGHDRFCTVVRNVQDVIFEHRYIQGPKMWLEKDLDKRDVDFVWFVTQDFVECGRPYIFTVWDLEYLIQPWFPEVSAAGEWESRHRLHRKAIPRAVKTIIPNSFAKEEAKALFGLPDDRWLVLSHPAGYLEANSTRPMNFPFGEGQKFLLYPSRFWPHKNHQSLLEGLSILNREHDIELPIIFVGSDRGSLSKVRESVQKLDLQRHVFFLGLVPDSELKWLYERAFALIYPSLFGPENLPPLEAFLFGCPVLAADVHGTREQLGDAALFFNPLEPTDIALRIKQIFIGEAFRQNLVEKGKQRAKQLSGKDYVGKVLDFFDFFERQSILIK